MSTPHQPPDPAGNPGDGTQPGQWGALGPEPQQSDPNQPDPNQPDLYGYVPVSPLLPEDPPKVGDFWLDARLGASAAGVAFTGHDVADRAAIVILLSEGAAADAAARDRFAGAINEMHIDAVYARGGHGQDFGRLARKYNPDVNDPVSPDERLLAPWAALAYDGSPTVAGEAQRVLDEVELASLPQQGPAAGPDYRHYWIDRVKPGLTRLWPLPWPGRYDRAGWRTILVSWLLMLLLAALGILIAILIFRNQPPQAPPPPTGGSGSPPPQSSSPSPQSGSPPPPSGSPSPSSAPPSPSSGSPSGSPSPGSASPSESPSGGGSPSPADTASAGGSSPGSRL